MIFSPVANLSQRKNLQYISFSGFTTDASSFTGTTSLEAGNYVIGLHNEGTAGRGTTSVTFKNATYGDVTATEVIDQTSQTVATSLYYVTLTNTATYDIATVLTGTATRFGMSLYKLNGFNSIVPLFSTSSSSTGAGSLSVTTNNTGYGIAITSNQSQNASPVNWSITGSSDSITENYDEVIESLVCFSGANYYQVDGNNTTSTSTYNTSAAAVLIVAIWD